MFEFISKVNCSIIICCLLSGCYHFENISLYVKNSSIQQSIKKTDRIAIVASRPDLENLAEFKTIKSRIQFHFKERGYVVVEKNDPTKPNLFALLEPSVFTKTNVETQQVWEQNFTDFSQMNSNFNNTYISSRNDTKIIYTYMILT